MASLMTFLPVCAVSITIEEKAFYGGGAEIAQEIVTFRSCESEAIGGWEGELGPSSRKGDSGPRSTL